MIVTGQIYKLHNSQSVLLLIQIYKNIRETAYLLWCVFGHLWGCVGVLPFEQHINGTICLLALSKHKKNEKIYLNRYTDLQKENIWTDLYLCYGLILTLFIGKWDQNNRDGDLETAMQESSKIG